MDLPQSVNLSVIRISIFDIKVAFFGSKRQMEPDLEKNGEIGNVENWAFTRLLVLKKIV